MTLTFSKFQMPFTRDVIDRIVAECVGTGFLSLHYTTYAAQTGTLTTGLRDLGQNKEVTVTVTTEGTEAEVADRLVAAARKVIRGEP